MGTETTILRRGRAADVGPISRLARDEVEAGLQWTWTPLRVAQAMAEADNLCVVATRGGRAHGFCITSYGFQHAHVLLLAVSPEHRGQGIGRAMMNWHIECARVAGLERISLELRASNVRGEAFYQRLGFSVSARARRYYQGVEDALRMELKLCVV